MALDYDLIVDQGADYEATFPVLNASGQPQSVGGWTVRGKVRARPSSATVLHTLDLTALGTDVTLTIPAATSATWAWAAGVYDVELVDPSGLVTRLAQGRVYVRSEVTY